MYLIIKLWDFWGCLVARGFVARRRFKKLLADGRRQAGLVADFLEYLPNGGTRIKDRVVKLIVADKARPKGIDTVCLIVCLPGG